MWYLLTPPIGAILVYYLMKPPLKIYYIDNIKVLLTILVVLHHCCVAYGAPGGWYYKESTTSHWALAPITIFVCLNQSFFMGFFFFLSSFFAGSSYDRKGFSKFVGDRLWRLGIPLLFYSFIFSPFLSYLVNYFAKGNHISYGNYLSGFDGWIDFGVLWFVAALLLFTLVYALWRVLSKRGVPEGLPLPGRSTILWFAAGTGLVSFVVRIFFPVGWVLKPLGFQPGHFTQYIVLFCLGLVAAKNNWLPQIPDNAARRFGRNVPRSLLIFVLFFILNITLHTPQEWYSGGFHWQSLLYALWEQLVGFSIIVALLSLGKRKWNVRTPLLGRLSRSAFAVYIFHPVVIISLSLAVRGWNVDPAVKLLVVAPLAVLGSFLLGALVTEIPGVKKVI